MALSGTGRCGQESWRWRSVGLSAAGAALAMFVPGVAQATESGVSLYLHGSGGPGTAVMAPLEGVYFDKITWVYDGDAGIERELPVNGRVVAGVDLTVVAEFATMLFVPSTDFLGGTFAVGVTLPYGAPMLDAAGVLERPGGGSLSASVHDTALTTGDPVGVAMLGWKEGDLHLQVSSMVNVPIGHFRESGLANLSLHRWAVDTSMAASWHDAEAGWDLSVKGGYTFNGSNETNGYDSGDEMHLEAALEKIVSPAFSFGLQSYYVKQVSDDGGALGPFRGEALAFGVTAATNVQMGRAPATFRGRVMQEVDVTNRLKGSSFWLDFSIPLHMNMPPQ
ncbi:SphA family protein [Novosphingobium aureum]|nr:transporter [Novosphingobium aureum]